VSCRVVSCRVVSCRVVSCRVLIQHVTPSSQGTSGMFQTWKKRWCVLTNGVFAYFKSATDGAPAGTVHLSQCVSVTAVPEHEVKGRRFCIRLLRADRDFVFQVPSVTRVGVCECVRVCVCARCLDTMVR
jgi:hypothetical protein